MERFPGVIVLTTNKIEDVDLTLFKTLQFNIEFPCPDLVTRYEK